MIDSLESRSELRANCSVSLRSLGDYMGVAGFVSCLLQLLSYLTLSGLPADMQTKKSFFFLNSSYSISIVVVCNFYTFLDTSHLIRFPIAAALTLSNENQVNEVEPSARFIFLLSLFLSSLSMFFQSSSVYFSLHCFRYTSPPNH